MRASRLSVLIAVVALLMWAPAARADHNDDFAAALPIQIGDSQTETTVGLSIQSGEWMTNETVGYCEGAFSAVDADQTAWHDVVGNGRRLTFSAHSPQHGVLIAVYRTLDFSALSSNLVGCNYDQSFSRSSVSLSWDSVAGHRYRIQVGRCRELNGARTGVASPNRCGTTAGTLHVSLSASAPGNDAMAAPISLDSGGGDYDNVGATVAGGETTTCGSTSYGSTVWFSWRAPAKGDVAFVAGALTSGLAAPVVSVFAGGARVDCGQGTARAAVEAGQTYLVQVAGLASAGGAQQGRFSVRPSFTQDYNVDDDPVPGPPAGNDCDDNDPRRYPGARDVPENGIDEDCKLGDARFPNMRVTPRMYFKGSPGAVRIRSLVLRAVPRGARVTLHCRRGPGCRRGSRIVTRRATRKVVRVPTRGYGVLRVGSFVELDVTLSGYVGRRFRWGPRFTRAGVPRHVEFCLHPRRQRPYRC